MTVDDRTDNQGKFPPNPRFKYQNTKDGRRGDGIQDSKWVVPVRKTVKTESKVNRGSVTTRDRVEVKSEKEGTGLEPGTLVS